MIQINSTNMMGITKLLMLILVLWIPKRTSSSTAKGAHFISCKDCNQTAGKTINWRCRFGCDKYYSATTPRAPLSVRKPTVFTGNTRKGSWVKCSSCYGHGKAKPTKDPRCKYGCDRYITFPPEYFHTTTKKQSTDEKNLEKNEIKEIPQRLFLHKFMTKSITKPSNAVVFSENKTNLHKSEPIQYHYVIVAIGLGTILIGTLIGSLYFKHKQKRVKTTTVRYAADNVVTNMYHE